jgi:hypothetical protein
MNNWSTEKGNESQEKRTEGTRSENAKEAKILRTVPVSRLTALQPHFTLRRSVKYKVLGAERSDLGFAQEV